MAIKSTWKEIAKSSKKKDVAYQWFSGIGLLVAMTFMYKAGAAKMLSQIAEDQAANEEEES